MSFKTTGGELATGKGAAVLEVCHELPQAKPASKWILGLVAALLLVGQTAGNILTKLFNSVTVGYTDGVAALFNAPFVVLWFMFLGESFSLVPLYIDKWISDSKKTPRKLDIPSSAMSFDKPPCPKYMWGIPAVFDFTSMALIVTSVGFCSVATVNLLRNFGIVLTAIFSVLWLKVAPRRHQIAGVLVLCAGLVISGLCPILYANPAASFSTEENASPALGVVLALAGATVASFQFVFEESLFRKYHVSPLEGVGMMGVFGMVYSIIALTIMFFTVPNTRMALECLLTSTPNTGSLWKIAAPYAVAAAIINCCGVMTTKLGSGVLRAVVMGAATIFIWLIEIIVLLDPFHALSLCGLIVVLLGVFMYNYNYLFSPGRSKLDAYLRPAVVFWGARDPDALETADSDSLNAASKAA